MTLEEAEAEIGNAELILTVVADAFEDHGDARAPRFRQIATEIKQLIKDRPLSPTDRQFIRPRYTASGHWVVEYKTRLTGFFGFFGIPFGHEGWTVVIHGEAGPRRTFRSEADAVIWIRKQLEVYGPGFERHLLYYGYQDG